MSDDSQEETFKPSFIGSQRCSTIEGATRADADKPEIKIKNTTPW